MPLPERQFLDRLRRSIRSKSRELVLGIGDDCAILRLPAGHEILVTTDFSLEGVHFRREWQSPECIGHRCLARGLSDIAAMGGTPIAAFLSLALPAKLPQAWVDRFFDGLLRLAKQYKVSLAGGDTAQSPGGVLADIMVVGSVRRGTALLRSGAKAGDLIYVTGELGESGAVLQLLPVGVIKKRDVLPEPRVAVGQWLARKRLASAAIDISDGLSTDLAHICEESGVGAAIHAEAIPIHPTARRVPERRAHRRGDHALDVALHGGEDYELLFTAPKSKRVPAQIAGVKITRIGEMVRGTKLRLIRNRKPEPLVLQGWEHFGRDRTV
jgi:thiamine-monophosphate kinase